MRRNSGFSLIELNCALFVVTAGIFGVLGTYQLVMDKTRALNEYALAERIVRNEIESLRALPFAALEAAEAAPFRSQTPGLERLVNATPTLTILDRAETAPGLKEVRARLAWTGEKGRTIRYELVTLIADKGNAP